MVDSEFRLRLARLRMELRDIDGEIEQLRREQQFYRRLGFGRDLQDIKMTTLVEQRQDCLSRLEDVQGRLTHRRRNRMGLRNWVLLGPMLVFVVARSLFMRARGVASV